MELFKHKLLAGVEIRFDYEAAPVSTPVLGRDGKPTGKTKEVYPTKTFKRGDTFYDPEDLCVKEPQRFGVVGGPRARTPVHVASNPGIAAPNGQVSDGFQETSGASGQRTSGVASKDANVKTSDGERTVGELTGETAAVAAKATAKGKMVKGTFNEAKDDAAFRAELEEMSLPALREHAKAEGVQLHGATSKADIVDALVKADRDDGGDN